jgi:glycosyltransferase involved in cell wall biosynthesis
MTKKIAVIGGKGFTRVHGGVEDYLANVIPSLTGEFDVVFWERKGYPTRESLDERVLERTQKRVVPLLGRWLPEEVSDIISNIYSTIEAKASGCDAAIFNGVTTYPAVALAKVLGLKTISVIHARADLVDKAQFIPSPVWRGIERMVGHLSDGVITASKGLEKYFEEDLGIATEYIPRGVSIPQNITGTLPAGLERDGYYLFIGRITQYKGVDLAIDAYLKGGFDKKLVIAGDHTDNPGYFRELQEKTAGNPNIIFLGTVSPETRDLLFANTYAAIFPSRIPSLPQTLLEARACSAPVIASSVHFIDYPYLRAECVQYDLNDEDALATAMMHPPKRSHSTLANYHSWDRHAISLAKMINKCIDPKGSTEECGYGRARI